MNVDLAHNRRPALNCSCGFCRKKWLYYYFSGMVGHNQPILPRGDPNAEKPAPRLHLDAPIHNDNAVRQEIIEEEAFKEDLENNPDDKNDAPEQLEIQDLANALNNQQMAEVPENVKETKVEKLPM